MQDQSGPVNGPATAEGPAAAPSVADPAGTAGPGILWLFTLTTFVSALLLFSIQPMFAKMVLPVLGGSPSVWAVALCFFQGALLAGYCYAHLIIRLIGARASGFVHLAVCLLAFVVLPIGLPAGWSEPPTGEPYFWQLGLFTVAVGLPFFAVAANAPLLQAWFAATGHPHGRDPYFLYAASNLGSLIALLSYPVLLEPAFGIGDADERQQFDGARLGLIGRHLQMNEERLHDLKPDPEDRVQRGHRLLENHRHVMTADAAHLFVGEFQEVATVEIDRAGRDLGRLRKQTHDREGRNGFSRARFTNDGDHLAGVNRVAYVLDRTHKAMG